MQSIVANLTPALVCQDHTTSPSARNIARQSMCGVHRIPLPTFVTIAKRPSCGSGTGRSATDLGSRSLRHVGATGKSGMARMHILPVGPPHQPTHKRHFDPDLLAAIATFALAASLIYSVRGVKMCVEVVGETMFRYLRHLLLLSAESHCVMMLRTVRLAGGGASGMDEAWRIVSEKAAATADIPQRLLQTRSPLVLTVGYRKMVRQNLRRLSAGESAPETR